MAASVIDELQIDIEAGLKSSGNLNDLVTSLEKLQRVVGRLGSGKSGQKFAEGMRIATSALNSLEQSINKLDSGKLDSLASAMNAISNIKMSSAKKSLDDINKSLAETTKNAQEAADALSNVSAPVDKSSVGDTTANDQTDQLRKQQQEALRAKASGAASALDSLGKASHYTGLNSLAGLFASLSAQISTMTDEEIEASKGMSTLAGMSGQLASGVAKLGTAFAGLGVAVEIVKKIYQAYKAIEGVGEKFVTTIANGVKKAVSVVKEFGSTVADMISKVNGAFAKLDIAGKLGKGMDALKAKIAEVPKAIRKNMDEASKHINKLIRTFFYMGIRKMFTAIYKEMQSALERLATYSSRMGTAFNGSVSSIKADFKYLADTIMTTLEPIINAVSSMLTALVDKIVAVLDVLNQLFSALGGGLTWTKANRGAEDYAKNLGKAGGAAKKLKDYTLGIDELNIFNDKDSGGGGGGGADLALGEFEVKPIDPNLLKWAKFLQDSDDWFPAGKALGDKLAEFLARIPWDKIKAEARKLAKRLATFINGFIKGEFNGISLGWWLGRTLAEAFNTAVEFLNEFVKDLDWSGLAQFLMDGIMGALQNIDWDLLFRLSKNLATGLIEFFEEAFSNDGLWWAVGVSIARGIRVAVDFAGRLVFHFPWEDFGKSIALLLGAALAGIDFKELGWTVGEAVNGIFDTIYGFAMNFPWTEVAQSVADGVNAFSEQLDFERIDRAVQAATEGIVRSINTLVSDINWEQLGQDVSEGIDVIIHAFDHLMTGINWDDIGTELAKFLGEALDFDWEGLGKGVTDGINSISELILHFSLNLPWEELATNISSFFNTALQNLNWPLIELTITTFATRLGGFFRDLADEIHWDEVGTFIGNAFRVCIEGLGAFFGQFKPDELASKILELITSAIEAADLPNAVDTINKLVQGLYDLIKNVVESEEFKSALDQISDALKNIDWKSVVGIMIELFKAAFEIHHATFATVGWEIIKHLFFGLILAIKNFFQNISPAKLVLDFINNDEVTQDALKSGESLGDALAKGLKNKFEEGVKDFKGGWNGFMDNIGVEGWHFDVAPEIEIDTSAAEQKMASVGNVANTAAEGTKNLSTALNDTASGAGEAASNTEVLATNIGTLGQNYDTFSSSVTDGVEAFSNLDEAMGFLAEVPNFDDYASGMDGITTNTAEAVKKYDELKQSLTDTTTASDALGTSFDNIMGAEKTGEYAKNLSQLITTFEEDSVTFTTETLPNFLTEVQTIFDENDWSLTYAGFKDGLALKWEEIRTWWNDEAMPLFWEEAVTPWWGEEKWIETTQGMVDAIKSQWDAMEKQWKTDIEKWWKDYVEEYFKEEKWNSVLEVIPKAFENAFHEGANKAIDCLNTALGGIEQFINECVNALNALADGANALATANGAPANAPKMGGVTLGRIPHFEQGGMVEPGQLFFANENGMAEAITNEGGRTQVTSHDELSGIRSALYETSDAEITLLQSLIDRAERVIDAIENKDLSIGDRAIAEANRRGQRLVGRSILT